MGWVEFSPLTWNAGLWDVWKPHTLADLGGCWPTIRQHEEMARRIGMKGLAVKIDELTGSPSGLRSLPPTPMILRRRTIQQIYALDWKSH